MSRPVTLREALLDPELLEALPGLTAALARIQTNPGEETIGQAGFVRGLRELATRNTPTAHAATTNEGDPMPTTTTSSDSHEQRRRERAERAEDEATAVRARVRIEEDRRVQEALRLAGYDAPVSERTRPATPRETSP